MDLCTVISQRFIPQALNLIQSYKVNSFNKKVYLYYFNTEKSSLQIFDKLFPKQVIPIEVEPVCEHALLPRVFFYKVYAINDCFLNHTANMIYSDSTNCFVGTTETLEQDLTDESLFMSYNHPGLLNQIWTTKQCFNIMNAPGAEIMPQYWAGFQVYKKTSDNIKFVTEMYDYMLDPSVALPSTTESRPDGDSALCKEHRQDQSVFSVLIHKHNRHQLYDQELTLKYGDWQTIYEFDNSFRTNIDKMILSPRVSKFGQFRFLRTQ